MDNPIRGGKIAVFGSHKIGAYSFTPHSGGAAVDASHGSGYAELPRLDDKVAVIDLPDGTTWHDTSDLGGALKVPDVPGYVSASNALYMAERGNGGFKFSGR